jgi:hypothetical protein
MGKYKIARDAPPPAAHSVATKCLINFLFGQSFAGF